MLWRWGILLNAAPAVLLLVKLNSVLRFQNTTVVEMLYRHIISYSDGDSILITCKCIYVDISGYDWWILGALTRTRASDAGSPHSTTLGNYVDILMVDVGVL